jgi:uncharacterized protein YndB with AHSA1/START domain
MRSLAFLAALLLAAPAAAQNNRAPPAVSAHRAGDGGEAQASMDVQAPPAVVWSVLSDCGQARRFMRDLISCRVLDHGQGWDVREHRVHGWILKPVMRNVSRITLEPNHRLAFHRIEGDWTRSEGEWVLTPIDNGRGTHVEYRINAAIAVPIPAALTQARLVARVRSTLADLRRVAEAQETARQTSAPAAP